MAKEYPTLSRWPTAPRWARNILRRPEDPWQLWQASAEAAVEGIDGPVDLNVARPGTAENP